MYITGYAICGYRLMDGYKKRSQIGINRSIITVLNRFSADTGTVKLPRYKSI
jgi:hypothetical protein